MTLFIVLMVLIRQVRHFVIHKIKDEKKPKQKYRNFLQTNKNSTKIEGQTITEWEAKLSQYNRKTLDFSKFMEYIKEKNIMNKAISSFYQGEIYQN